MELREKIGNYTAIDTKENHTKVQIISADSALKGFRKFLSTRNLLIAAFLMAVLGVSNIVWMSTRYYEFCH